MTENARNKAAISEETIEELSRYVMGAVPVMAKIDMTSEEMDIYDKIGKYALGAIPLMVNPNDAAEKDK
ncbi:hypothetical protein ADH76_11460 [Enterocloster clostridioformis]|uniref:hypothetical protein n=1 Tax=Enterocloster clostridioformis TaxID=1531 RepID=UPI00080C8B31|nr:hypothetical protein [Enterocloster clostridioformis]ANU48270.1 hypothetical protein A4V08_23150 [Lachnoclostridium sp. YL32]OXE69023.1 hypothetical protein ADH76_11460 [Enterocloster clostridioformis]QQR02841.1 hypothetical protein I5Q83_11660 [Enterocloster clostridioformis]